MPTKQDYENSRRRRELGLAWCCACKCDKPQDEFDKCLSRRPFGLASRCRACERNRKAELAKKIYWSMTAEERYSYNRKWNIKTKFGITLEQYDAMLDSQGGVCAICKLPETVRHHSTKTVQPLVVDHNHDTGTIRGLLCTKCNKAIGLLMHNTMYLSNAIDYLSKNEVEVIRDPA